MTIRCRAKVSESCQDGRPVGDVYEDGMSDDSTWDGSSVVCDFCYIIVEPFMRMNTGSVPAEADVGIAHYRANMDFVRKSEDPAALVAEAKQRIAGAQPGSPHWISAGALLRMAEAEVKRRAGSGDQGHPSGGER